MRVVGGCTCAVGNNCLIGNVPLDMEDLLWSSEGCGVCNNSVVFITVGFIASDVIGRFGVELWVRVLSSSETSDNIGFGSV